MKLKKKTYSKRLEINVMVDSTSGSSARIALNVVRNKLNFSIVKFGNGAIYTTNKNITVNPMNAAFFTYKNL